MALKLYRKNKALRNVSVWYEIKKVQAFHLSIYGVCLWVSKIREDNYTNPYVK